MTTFPCGATTEVPEQRPKPIPAPSEMKIAPLTRYGARVGSSIVSEVAVSAGSSAEPWAGGEPSRGRAASIRAGVQKWRAAVASSRKEIDGIAACAAGAPTDRAVRTRMNKGRGKRIGLGTQADGEAIGAPFRYRGASPYPARPRITCRDARPRRHQPRARRECAPARSLGPRSDRRDPRPRHRGRGIRLPPRPLQLPPGDPPPARPPAQGALRPRPRPLRPRRLGRPPGRRPPTPGHLPRDRRAPPDRRPTLAPARLARRPR